MLLSQSHANVAPNIQLEQLRRKEFRTTARARWQNKFAGAEGLKGFGLWVPSWSTNLTMRDIFWCVFVCCTSA